jgi:sigma-B regulation protein RsbU (phosphoserine phosphatase)
MAKLHPKANQSPPSNRVDEATTLRRKVDELRSLIEVSIIINSASDLDELITLVMEKAQSVMNAEASSVMLINEEKNILECTFARGEVGAQIQNKIQLQIGEGIAGWVAKHGQPLIVPDVSVDARFASKVDDSTGFRTRTILAAPLMVKDKIIGVAEVINRMDGEAFNGDNLELFSTFCRQVAMAIENARMYQLKMEKQKLEQQLEAAKTIQQSFMPQTFPDGPDKKFSIAGRSLPAVSIGGDFFDIIEFGDNHIGIAVGDVTGKGIPAALYMARFVSDFRIYSRNNLNPLPVLKALNDNLVERSRRGMFVTFQYGILNVVTGEFIYANAGHIPFIRIHGRTHTIELLKEAKSIPLGILPEINLKEETVQLAQGDVIVSITDGIIEAKNKLGGVYSLERTLDILSGNNRSVQELVDDLLKSVQDFAIGVEQYDDLTVLALKWR